MKSFYTLTLDAYRLLILGLDVQLDRLDTRLDLYSISFATMLIQRGYTHRESIKLPLSSDRVNTLMTRTLISIFCQYKS